MKLAQLIPMHGMTEFEWRTRQAKKLQMAIAQAPSKAEKHELERQAKRLEVKIRALQNG